MIPARPTDPLLSAQDRVASDLVGTQTVHPLAMTMPGLEVEGHVQQNQEIKIFDSLHRAAKLAREGSPNEALLEFNSVLATYRQDPRESVAVFAVKAAYNRAILFETLLRDNIKAQQAFEETFREFHRHVRTEVRTVALRAGLHVARLIAAQKRYAEAVQCYHERLPLATDLIPPTELGAFVDHFRRVVARDKEVRQKQARDQQRPQAANQPVALGDSNPSFSTLLKQTQSEIRAELAELRSRLAATLDRVTTLGEKHEHHQAATKTQHAMLLEIVQSRYFDLKDQQLNTHSFIKQEFARIDRHLRRLRARLAWMLGLTAVVLLGFGTYWHYSADQNRQAAQQASAQAQAYADQARQSAQAAAAHGAPPVVTPAPAP